MPGLQWGRLTRLLSRDVKNVMTHASRHLPATISAAVAAATAADTPRGVRGAAM